MRSRILFVCLFGAMFGAVAVPGAEAIPAFARKYQFSCSTCHAPVPRLKPFGEAFAARGFRLEDPSQEPARATYDVGDPTLRLMRELPLALRLEGYAQTGQNESLNFDFQWPWVFKILSGGQITKSISYYVYFIIETGDVVGLEDAWVQLNSVFKSPIDLTVGQFQVCDPLFKRELRLERFDYQIFKTQVGSSAVDLTYDRGLIAAWDFPGKLESVLQVVNGVGIGVADEWGNFDSDNYKSVAYRLARPFKKWRVGAFGYWGRGKGTNGATNTTYYIGPDLVIDFSDRLQLNAEYLERRDDNPSFAESGASGTWQTRGGFVELIYLPRGSDGKWSVAGLYNQVASDDENARFQSVSATLGYLLARNVRLTFDVGHEFERLGFKASIGLVTAF